ncbi:MAG: cyclic nucleotide-binding domain-containing protein, partial [Myxococcota bacterium]|nr:cyclic nucleotide-binding domain-containing protein [Myxococcota bacterium]
MELQPGLLRDVAIFGGLSEETLAFVLDRATRVRVALGEHFITEGEMGKSFFVLETGRVRVHKDADGDAITLCDFGPGDAFGEMSLLAVRPRSATIEAIEDCVAI